MTDILTDALKGLMDAAIAVGLPRTSPAYQAALEALAAPTKLNRLQKNVKNKIVENFADETITFTKKLFSSIRSNSEDRNDADGILASVISILMQPPHALAELVQLGCSEISIESSSASKDEASEYKTLYIKIVRRIGAERAEI